MATKDFYSDKFYNEILPGSKRSAEIILPIVFSQMKPKSIIDVGCGTGVWLSVSKKNDIMDVLGLDGNYAVNNLQIESGEFRATDISKGFVLERTYDLALCLEVAEHISTDKSEILVDSLTKSADVILFSAAPPGQGGIRHINEQWPDFWYKLFQKKGFVCIDCIRPLIFNNPAVEWWYRQNVLLYINRKIINKFPRWEAQQNGANDILFLHKSLLKKRYGFLNSCLYPFKYVILSLLQKIGLYK